MNDITENINETPTCAICLEQLTIPSPNICITECNHVFHLNCFLQNREFNRLCPMCRSDIPIGAQNEQHHIVALPDVMIDDDNLQDNALLNRFEVLEEIAIGTQLQRRIREIADFASNNNISNFELGGHDVIDNVHEQIYNICMFFLNSTLNYFRNREQNSLNINNINIQFHTNLFNLHDRITIVIDNAANNNIRDNRTFDRLEHNIHNLCIEFSESILDTERVNIHYD
jgi:hypothetical protein